MPLHSSSLSVKLVLQLQRSDIRSYSVQYLGYAKPSKPNVCLGLVLQIRGAVPASLHMFHLQPPGQPKVKELDQTSRSHTAQDSLLVYPEQRKSRSTPLPITLLTTRCLARSAMTHIALLGWSRRSSRSVSMSPFSQQRGTGE